MDKEIKAGKLPLPAQPTVGFAMRGPINGYNPATNAANSEIRRWQMVQLPYATGRPSASGAGFGRYAVGHGGRHLAGSHHD